MNKEAYEAGVEQACMEKLGLNPELLQALIRPASWGGIGAGMGTAASGLGALMGGKAEDTPLLKHLGKGALMGGLAGLGAGVGAGAGQFAGKGLSALLHSGERAAGITESLAKFLGGYGGGLAALGPAVGLATGEKLPPRSEVRKMQEAEQAGTYTPGDPWPQE